MSSLMDVGAGHMGALSLFDMSVKIAALAGRVWTTVIP